MRFLRFLSVFMLIILMCSCSRVVKNTADEIRLNEWSTDLKNNFNVSLKFNDDKARFIIRKKNNIYCEISGTSFMDKRALMIFDENDKRNYTFDYKLNGNILALKYDGGSVRLKRVKNK